MPVFHYLALRAFAHETEEPDKVKAAMRHVAHVDDITIEETSAEGSHGNRILILEAMVKSAQAERALFAGLARDDAAGYARLAQEAPRRLDEHLNFFLRLDKQEALAGRMVLAADDDAITVRARLRAFPAGGVSAGDAARQALHAFLLQDRRSKVSSHD